jgi:DNA-binding response OmpR family regulator
MRVLVLEADPDLRRSLLRALDALGHEGLASEQSVPEAITRKDVDVVLCESNLLDEEGLGLCGRLSVLRPHPAIVLLAGDAESARRAAAASHLPVIPKPFQLGQLRAFLGA